MNTNIQLYQEYKDKYMKCETFKEFMQLVTLDAMFASAIHSKIIYKAINQAMEETIVEKSWQEYDK